MKPLRHQVIFASAGSGKTFQLAHRYIGLLARGVSPDRIMALTFSRKAAAEIFDAIIENLVKASTSASDARDTAKRIACEGLKPPDFLRLLHGLLSHLGRLHIGTLDSFAVGIVHAFPMELGIAAGLDIMDNAGAPALAAQREVLSLIFNQRGARARQREFFEAFKQATFGREEKGLERNLANFLQSYLRWYRLLPDGERWGNEKIIWPKGHPWTAAGTPVAPLAEELVELIPTIGLPPKLAESVSAFALFAGPYTETSIWDADATSGKFFETLAESLSQLESGEFEMEYYKKKCVFPPRACEILFQLVHHLFRTEITRCLRETKGIFQMLDQFEHFYDGLIRRRGRLTFDDVQYLLAGKHLSTSSDGDDALRLYIDYRLDSRLDHWLLDEFQDTSDLQWSALRNLADEVLQDTSGERSFFYVGDVKQAIYGWRGGNALLFGQLAKRYRDRIEKLPLHTSFRSCPPVIDTVNKVFSDLPEGLPEAAAELWKEHWDEHSVEDGRKNLSGYVALLEPKPGPAGEKPSETDRYHVVANLLNELKPLERGLSVAVLVRQNDVGHEVVSQLRAECPGLTIVHEGNAPLRDNAVVSALMSLVQCAGHPGDTFAWRHVQMSPLGAVLEKEGIGHAALVTSALRTIQENGFAALFRTWGDAMRTAHSIDYYGLGRLHDLIEASAEFDRSASRDINGFIDFIDEYQLKERAAAGAVRVMTIHQSKGLGFDVVILPDLQGRSMVKTEADELAVARGENGGEPEWALKLPRRVVTDHDPVLREQARRSEESRAFENLCTLYVALTRAKRGLYMVTSFPGKTSKTMTPAAYLKHQLTGDTKGIKIAGENFDLVYEKGKRDWYVAEKKKDVEITAVPRTAKRKTKAPARRRRLLGVSPSRQAEQERSGDLVFAAATQRKLGVGSALHALFEKIEWMDTADVEASIRTWRAEFNLPAADDARVVDQFRRSLESEEIRQCLKKASASSRVWRERSFDVVLGDTWVSGRFDRVVIEKERATIYDFKSNDIEDESHLRNVADGYAPQMSAYRRVLAKLLGRAESKIAVKLIFTQPAKVIEV